MIAIKLIFLVLVPVLSVQLPNVEYIESLITEFQDGELGPMDHPCLGHEVLKVKKYEDFEGVFQKPFGANEYFITSSEGIYEYCMETVGTFLVSDYGYELYIPVYTINTGEASRTFKWSAIDLKNFTEMTTVVDIDNSRTWKNSTIKILNKSSYKMRLEYTSYGEEDVFFAIDKFVLKYPDDSLESTTVTDEPTITEDTTPGPEDTTAVTDETSTVTEDTTPEPEDTTAVTEDTTPEPEDTTAVTDETPTVTEDTTPEPEDTTAVTEDTTPEPEDTTAVTDETPTVTEDTTPEPEDTTAVTDETSTVTEDTTPEPEDTTAVTEDTTPEPEDTTAVTDETSTVTEDTTAVTDETSTVTEDTTAATNEPTVTAEPPPLDACTCNCNCNYYCEAPFLL